MLRFKTGVVSESLVFIYLSIHFILSVPQVCTSVFLYLSAKSDAVHGAERTLPAINLHPVSDINMSASCLQDTFGAACLSSRPVWSSVFLLVS